MADLEVGQVGIGGIVTDKPAYELPLHAWSDGLNVEFDLNGVGPMTQETEILNPFQGNPLGVFAFLQSTNDQVWVYGTATKLYSVVDGTHTDITRSVGGDYSASDIVKWNGGILNGVPVVNNSFDVPQKIDPLAVQTAVVDLPNWPSTLRTNVLRPFGNFLIAIGASDTGISYPTRTLVWSDPADPGEVPPSWDWADPATRAGVKTFSESGGLLIDGRTLRDQFIIYKNDSIWSMRFIGGTLVMSFKPLFEDVGLINANAVVAFEKHHLFVSKRDVYIHDGITLKSIADEIVRERIFTELNVSHISNIFCQHEPGADRVWIYYPSGDAQFCNRAAIWNYRHNTWTFRETPHVVAGSQGFFDIDLGDIWDDQGLTWDALDIADFWNGAIYSSTDSNIVMFSYVGAATYDAGTDTSTDGNVTWSGNSTFPPAWFVPRNGVRKEGWVQRTGLTLMGKDHLGQPAVNKTLRKALSEIWPEVTKGPVQIRIGTQETPLGAVTWGDYQDFDAATDLQLHVFESSKYFAIEFRSTTNLDAWFLAGYALKLENAGRY